MKKQSRRMTDSLPTLLFFAGVLIMAITPGAYFVLGSNVARLGLLACGVAMVCAPALLHIRQWGRREVLWGAGIVLVFSVLTVIAVAMEQDVHSPLQVAFRLIAAGLLFSGYAWGRYRREGEEGRWLWVLLPVVIFALVSMYRLWLAANVSEGRTYEDTEMNPIGIAYYNAVVFVTCTVLAFSRCGVAARIGFGCGASISALLILSSGSRGAFIWTICAFAVLLPILGVRVFRRVGLVFTGVLMLGVAVWTGALIVEQSEGGEARIEMMRNRLEALYYGVLGEGGDRSASERTEIWGWYFDNWERVLPFGERG